MSSDTEDEDLGAVRPSKKCDPVLIRARVSEQTRSQTSSSDEDLDYVATARDQGGLSSLTDVLTGPVGEKPDFSTAPLRRKKDIRLGEKVCYRTIETDCKGDTTVLPGTTAQWLRPYQIDGICFLYDAYKEQTGRILGDDMGLGKTVQVIAFLNAVFGKNGTKSDWYLMRNRRNAGQRHPVALIVCPGTLLDNWARELDTWSYTHHSKYHGKDKQSSLSAIASGSLEVLLTTYHTYRTDADLINDVYWDVVIADECHIIKEPKARVTQAMTHVNSQCRIGLTGTAIQNNYDELHTLLNWTNPGKFGSANEWSASVSSVLKNGQKHNATNEELNNARQKAVEICNNLLPTVLLRRTKQLIAHQLPKKTDRVVFCPLTYTQITAYDNLMESDDVTFLRDAQDPCDCGKEKPRPRIQCCYPLSPDGLEFKDLMFRYLHILRQLSNHLALILPKKGDNPLKREKGEILLDTMLPEDYETLMTRTMYTNGSDPELCGKWKILVKLLRHWKREKAKVLVFSSSVQLLDMLNDLMTQHSYSYEYLHGGMTLQQRSEAVDKFNDNPEDFVFLISTRAGGVGLNIVSANKVVIFDPSWNPAHDLQAQDRAFRIGQRRDVEVYRLVSVGTVEEVVYARQIYKQQQANIGYDASEERRYFKGVQGDIKQRGELFGVKNLLTFHGQNHVLKNIFNNTSVVEQQFDIQMASLHIQEQTSALDPAKAEPSDDGGIGDLVNADGTLKNDASTPIETDPVSAILASAGVEYTHRNTEVIGPSEIEAAITRLAAEAAGQQGTRSLAANAHALHATDGIQYQIGRVPHEVQLRQFQSLAKFAGFTDKLKFAIVVQKMSADQRKLLLVKFYRHRKATLAHDGSEQAEAKEEQVDSETMKRRNEIKQAISNKKIRQF